MRFLRLLSLLSLVLVLADAEPAAHLHLRVAAAASTPVPQWGQCKWENKVIPCAAGLQCAISSKWFGMCVTKVADLWEQCAGNGWTATCKRGKCVKQDNYYSQCRP